MQTQLKINRLIDHTLLSPQATKEQIINLCQEAIKYDFFSVCINPYNVFLAAKNLAHSNVAVCAVIGFPLGASTTETKVFETKKALLDGATEIDMVINIGALKNGDDQYVLNDIKEVVTAAGNGIVKVIFETCLLTDAEKIKACQLSSLAGAKFVKTSTGFSTSGATLADVKLMKANINSSMEVKASGGVRSLESAKEFIKAGATRLGTSSGIAIINGLENNQSNY